MRSTRKQKENYFKTPMVVRLLQDFNHSPVEPITLQITDAEDRRKPSNMITFWCFQMDHVVAIKTTCRTF